MSTTYSQNDVKKYYNDWYKNKNNRTILLNVTTKKEITIEKLKKNSETDEKTDVKVVKKEYTFEQDSAITAMLQKRLNNVDTLYKAGNAGKKGELNPVEAFDQLIAGYSVEKLQFVSIFDQHGGSTKGIKDVYQAGGICVQAARLWAIYMANPFNLFDGKTFGESFDPIVALDQKENGFENYDEHPYNVPTHRASHIWGIANQTSPLFKEIKDWKDDKVVRGGTKKITTDLLDKYLIEKKARYIFFFVNYEKSGHVLVAARPNGDDEYHVFDSNLGWYKGNKTGCAGWIDAQFKTIRSKKNGWGGVEQVVLEYTTPEATENYSVDDLKNRIKKHFNFNEAQELKFDGGLAYPPPRSVGRRARKYRRKYISNSEVYWT